MAMWAVSECLNNVEADKRARMRREGYSEAQIQAAVDEMYRQNARSTLLGGLSHLIGKLL